MVLGLHEVGHAQQGGAQSAHTSSLQGGGGNPFDMKNLMESVKKAQQLVQQETQRVQVELAKWVQLALPLLLGASAAVASCMHKPLLHCGIDKEDTFSTLLIIHFSAPSLKAMTRMRLSG